MRLWLAIAIVVTAASAPAQEAFKVATPNKVAHSAESRFALALTQVASGIERRNPFQMQPVLAFGVRWNEFWSSGVAYDFQSLALGASREVSPADSRWRYGLSAALLPESRTFSWKAGVWAGREFFDRHFLSLSAEIASLNAWGNGVWAADLDAAPSGRAYVLPLLATYSLPVVETLRASFAIEFQNGLFRAPLRNRLSLLVGLAKEFP